MDYGQQSSGGGRGVFWFVIVLVIIILIVVVFLVFHFSKQKALAEEQAKNVKYTINMRALSDHAEVPVNVSYSLSKDGTAVQEGIVYTGKVEQYVEADNVTQYVLSGTAVGHYKGSTTCNYASDCLLRLEKIGSYVTNIMTFPDRQAVVTNIVDGNLNDVLVCIRMDWGVKDVILRNKDVLPQIPVRLEPYCDKAYSIGDLLEGKYYVFEFTWVIEDEREKGIEIWFVDNGGDECEFCAEDYKFGLVN